MSSNAKKAAASTAANSTGSTPVREEAIGFGHVSATRSAAGPVPKPGPKLVPATSKLKITLSIGDMEPVERTFAPGEVTIGRRPSNDLVIDGEGLKVVSGFHMRFAYESGRWCIEDSQSTNGTYLNGQRTTGLHAIREGDVIELGRPRKAGTYRAVKLTVALSGTAAAQATADSPPIQGPNGAAPPTLVASPKADPPPPPPAEIPRPKPKRVPAVHPGAHPAGLRELIAQVQEKSRRLGEVSYRLDAYVDDLASAAVERHVALGVADVPGGTAVIDLIAKEERLNATLQTLESELPDVRTRLVEELTPLEQAASKTKEISDAATAQFRRCAKRRDEGLASLKEAFNDLTERLRSDLAPIAAVLDEESASALSASPAAALDPATGEPVWKFWSVALQSGMEKINAQQEELTAIRAEAADADELARTAEAEAKAAEAEWSAARQEADERRAAIESSVTEKEAVFADATAQIAAVQGSMGATAKEFILSLLGAPESASGSLGSLTGMKDARRLFREVEVLSQELAELEQRADLG